MGFRSEHLLLLCVFAVATFFAGSPLAKAQDEESESERAGASIHLPQRGQVFVVVADVAPVFSDPETLTKVAATLKRGRRVVLTGEERNGYYRVDAKGGASAWISAAVLQPERTGVASSGAAVGRKARAARASVASAAVEDSEAADSSDSSGSSWLGLHAVTFDLGGSFGSYNDRNYTEVDLGLNLYLNPYLAWRNAVFGRFISGASTLYGLDTSARGILSVGSGLAGFTMFAGPGYRFINEGGHTPFAEGGLVLKLAGISLGGGVKTLLNSWVRSGMPNDTQYFIILAGGGSL